jgi:hypothetical protein
MLGYSMYHSPCWRGRVPTNPPSLVPPHLSHAPIILKRAGVCQIYNLPCWCRPAPTPLAPRRTATPVTCTRYLERPSYLSQLPPARLAPSCSHTPRCTATPVTCTHYLDMCWDNSVVTTCQAGAVLPNRLPLAAPRHLTYAPFTLRRAECSSQYHLPCWRHPAPTSLTPPCTATPATCTPILKPAPTHFNDQVQIRLSTFLLYFRHLLGTGNPAQTGPHNL